MQLHHATPDLDALSVSRNTPRWSAFMSLMPVISGPDSPHFPMAEWVMSTLGAAVSHEGSLMYADPGAGQFHRDILVSEPPIISGDGILKHGAEMAVVNWGEGFSTPIHLHNQGYVYEKLLGGRLLEIEYVRTAAGSNVLRQKKATIFEHNAIMERRYLSTTHEAIHSVRALESSTSVHFFPDHRSINPKSPFVVDYFEDVFALDMNDVYPVSHETYMSAEVGRVFLVRSSRIPGLGDHYIVVTGDAVQKPWGLRLLNDTIVAPTHVAKYLLDYYEDGNPYGTTEFYGATILHLNREAEKNFKLFHNIA